MITSPGNQLFERWTLHSHDRHKTEARDDPERRTRGERGGPFPNQLSSAAASPRRGQNSRSNRHCLAQSGTDEYNRRNDELDRQKLRDGATTPIAAKSRGILQPTRAVDDERIFLFFRP